MSSRSIISSSLGCKCSFDHSLHFVSIYRSQDSANLKQQHSASKETWAPSAYSKAEGRCFVCFLNYSLPKFCKLLKERAPRGRRTFFFFQGGLCESGTRGTWRLLEAQRCSSRSEIGTGEGVLHGQNLFYLKVPARLLGLIHSALKSSKPTGLHPERPGAGLLLVLTPCMHCLWLTLRSGQSKSIVFELQAQEAQEGLRSNALLSDDKQKFFSTI